MFTKRVKIASSFLISLAILKLKLFKSHISAEFYFTCIWETCKMWELFVIINEFFNHFLFKFLNKIAKISIFKENF